MVCQVVLQGDCVCQSHCTMLKLLRFIYIDLTVAQCSQAEEQQTRNTPAHTHRIMPLKRSGYNMIGKNRKK